METCASCDAALVPSAKFCSECGAAVGEPADLTYVERLLEADWRSAVLAALPAALVAFVAGQLVAVWLLMEERRSVDDLAEWLHRVCAVVGLAFGSPAAMDEDSVARIMPLSVTALALGALWFWTRRSRVPGGGWVDAALHGVRVLVLFALPVAAVSAFGGDSGSDPYTTSPGRAFLWALVLGAPVVAWALRDRWPAAPDPYRARVAAHGLAWRAGAFGLATGVLLGGAAGVAVLLADVGDVMGPGTEEPVRALPLLLGFLVNVGTAVLGIAVGGSAETYDSGRVALYDRHGASPAYLLAVLIPVVAVAAGVWYAVTRRGTRSDREVVRACYRMAAAGALGWWVLAVLSRIAFGVDGATVLGPNVALGTLLVAVTFLLGGWVLGRIAVRLRPADPEEPVRRVVAPLPPTVAFVASAALAAFAVLFTVGAALAAPWEQPGRVSALTGETAASAAPVDADLDAALRMAAAAEASYFAATSSYTDDLEELESFGYRPHPGVSIVVRDTGDLCLEATSPAGDVAHLRDGADGVAQGPC